MKKLSLSILLLNIAISSSFAAAGKDCRLLMKGYDDLIGNNAELEKSVVSLLAKKDIELIQDSDLREGDYSTDIIKNFEDYRGLPVHRYLMTKKKSVKLVPCNGFPLCSPVILDSEVKSIDAIKYEDIFRFDLLTANGQKRVLEKKFGHTFRGELMFDQKGPEYFGSPEQIDLVLALAQKIPTCKKLSVR